MAWQLSVSSTTNAWVLSFFIYKSQQLQKRSGSRISNWTTLFPRMMTIPIFLSEEAGSVVSSSTRFMNGSYPRKTPWTESMHGEGPLVAAHEQGRKDYDLDGNPADCGLHGGDSSAEGCLLLSTTEIYVTRVKTCVTKEVKQKFDSRASPAC